MCKIIFEFLLNTFAPGAVDHMSINLFSEIYHVLPEFT